MVREPGATRDWISYLTSAGITHVQAMSRVLVELSSDQLRTLRHRSGPAPTEKAGAVAMSDAEAPSPQGPGVVGSLAAFEEMNALVSSLAPQAPAPESRPPTESVEYQDLLRLARLAHEVEVTLPEFLQRRKNAPDTEAPITPADRARIVMEALKAPDQLAQIAAANGLDASQVKVWTARVTRDLPQLLQD